MTGGTPTQLATGLLARVATATPEPADIVDTPPPELVTPGTIGFLVTFVAALAVVLLLRDMVRRNRRIQVRADHRDSERRAEAATPGTVDPGTADPDRTGDPGGQTGTSAAQAPEGPAGLQGPVDEGRGRRRTPPAR